MVTYPYKISMKNKMEARWLLSFEFWWLSEILNIDEAKKKWTEFGQHIIWKKVSTYAVLMLVNLDDHSLEVGGFKNWIGSSFPDC